MLSRNIAQFGLAAIVLTSLGCASTKDVQGRQQGLQATMEQCLASQNRNSEQLAQQQTQLGTMMTALSGIRSDIASLEADPDVASDEKEQVTCSSASPAALVETRSAKMIVGQLENIWLDDLQIALPARIDTGAETASLDARNIELFERNGRRWVKFEILHPTTGESIAMERKLKRMALIVQSNSSEPERRPVIKLAISVGHITQSAEFTLSDRSHLDHQMLIGRNILQDVMIVDVSRKNAAPQPDPKAASKSDSSRS